MSKHKKKNIMKHNLILFTVGDIVNRNLNKCLRINYKYREYSCYILTTITKGVIFYHV